MEIPIEAMPRIAITFGQVFGFLGCAGALAGAWGKVATTGVNVLPTIAKLPQTTKTLADIYPQLPTWWIPESIFGFAIYLGLIGVGLLLVLSGKELRRQLAAL